MSAHSTSSNLDNQKKMGMIAFVKEPRVAMLCAAVMVLSADWSYLDPTLQPHLEQFNLSANQLGLLFLLASGTYAFSSPIWGWVSDRWINGWTLVSAGLVFLGVILLCLGPSPWIPYLPQYVHTH
jgi:MFS family permease